MLQKFKLILIAFMVTAISGKAQNFSYTLSKDSVSYTELTSPTVIGASGENLANKKLPIHLPFQFNFCGSATDSLTIEGNGYVVMDKLKQLSIVAFNNFRSNKDTTQSYVSSIAYSTIGSQGSRVTKIEFKNLSQNQLSNSDYLNYQVWLYESGNKIELHIGANSYAANSTISTGDSTKVYSMPEMLGVLNRNMNTTDKAYLITGNPLFPNGQAISGDTELVYINNIPYSGTVYTLTPSF